MNRQASILFNFISSSSSGNSLALQSDSAQRSFYQWLIQTFLARSLYSFEGFQLLGSQLADIAHRAYFLRQLEAVEQVSRMMLTLPITSELKGIAYYYQAISAKRKNDFEGARRLLEQVVEEAPQRFRARALLTIGATYFDNGEVEAALPLYLSAGRASQEFDLFTQIESQRNLAVIRSLHGDHKQALKDIENLFPLVRAISKRYPPLYYSFLNSLAVELGEVGRVNEAQAICKITLDSPFAAAYPEFAQTRDDLQAKRTVATHSIVAVRAALRLAPSLQAQPQREAEPSRSLAISWPVRAKTSFQRSNLLIVANAAIALIGTIQSILDRVRYSINPRSPPSRFQV